MDSKGVSRTWSLSRKSKDHAPLKLSVEEKRRSKMSSSADPTKAITEEEPFAVSQSKPSVGLRGFQYKDIYGNPITEPDLTNPTRSRWERPLDTIRSFEAAIHMDSKRQSAFYVVDTVDSMDHSQKQVQHNPGPFDPSLYHRNHGAQRYAPVDAYGNQGNSYYRHNSQESVMDNGRPVMPAARGYGDRRSESRTPPLVNPYANRSMEQQPPMPYPDGRAQSMRNRPGPPIALHGDFRKHHDQSYHHYSSSAGSAGHDSYNYNSDPASESSSLGSNAPRAMRAPVNNEYETILSFSPPDQSQLNFQIAPTPNQFSGHRDGNGDEYTNERGGEGHISGNWNQYSNNPLTNGDTNGGQTTGDVDFNGGMNASSSNASGWQSTPIQSNGTNIPRKPLLPSINSPPPAPAPALAPATAALPPGKAKKKKLLRRFSKS